MESVEVRLVLFGEPVGMLEDSAGVGPLLLEWGVLLPAR